MKTNFILLHRDAEPENKGGGFTPEQKGELSKAIGDLQVALETKQKGIVEAELKKHSDTINESLKKFGDSLAEKDASDQKNQKALDEVLAKFKDMQSAASSGTSKVEAKSLQMAMHEALADPENIKQLERVGRGERAKIMLKGPIDMSAGPVDIYDNNMIHKMQGGGYAEKAAGTLTTGNILTGQGVVQYNNRQVILPAQKVNARDLVPTVRSETGTYVTFRETAGQGAPGFQPGEGGTKALLDFRFSRVETVNQYIAGIAQFSKQLMRNIPFLQNTLPRLLQREFFKVENRNFYDVMATAYAAGGASNATDASNSGDDVMEIMDWLTTLFDADYVPGFGVLRYKALNRLNKLLYKNGYYQGSGGVLSQPDGSVRIMGVPILPVTWVPSFDKFLTFDQDYVERIEVESLAIEFFEQDGTNVQQNLMTARIECFEAFNAMQPASIILGDFGNSSTS